MSGIAYDRVGQAVLRLKAAYKELQSNEEDQVENNCQMMIVVVLFTNNHMLLH